MKPHDIDHLFLQLVEAVSKGISPEIVFRAPGDAHWQPMTDIYETEDSMVIKMELAGIHKDDINIGIDGGRLIVRGHRKDESKTHGSQKKRNYLQMEINYGDFERIISLPEGLDTQSIRAEFPMGFLRITIGKRPPKPVIIVSVSDGEGGTSAG